ncbi:hypothetical protein Tco_1006206 [Tanacetum coccineum]|uniref:Uncharacterized protein n=1 Tax=Tanacetum coccineum TaxID=301880 RepID=A0ABQ5FIF6_9ASTR
MPARLPHRSDLPFMNKFTDVNGSIPPQESLCKGKILRRDVLRWLFDVVFVGKEAMTSSCLANDGPPVDITEPNYTARKESSIPEYIWPHITTRFPELVTNCQLLPAVKKSFHNENKNATK